MTVGKKFWRNRKGLIATAISSLSFLLERYSMVGACDVGSTLSPYAGLARFVL